MTIVTNIEPKALVYPGVSNSVGGTSAPYVTAPLALGPMIDLHPVIENDQRTVRLSLKATLTEFLGYDHPSNSVPIYVNGKKEEAVPPIPRVKVGTITNTVEVPDGGTVVLGGLRSENVSVVQDKVPLLGDLPVMGRFFRSEIKSSEAKQLLVFVTPTLIDPEGNLMHPKSH
jgi:general secretion pathway protein D